MIMYCVGLPCIVCLFIPSTWLFVMFALPFFLLAIDWRDKHEKDFQLFLEQIIAYEQSLTEQLEKDKVNT